MKCIKIFFCVSEFRKYKIAHWNYELIENAFNYLCIMYWIKKVKETSSDSWNKLVMNNFMFWILKKIPFAINKTKSQKATKIKNFWSSLFVDMKQVIESLFAVCRIEWLLGLFFVTFNLIIHSWVMKTFLVMLQDKNN